MADTYSVIAATVVATVLTWCVVSKNSILKRIISSFLANQNVKSAPEFLRPLCDKEVGQGQDVTFRAKVKGYPQPRIIWRKDGKRIVPGGDEDGKITIGKLY